MTKAFSIKTMLMLKVPSGQGLQLLVIMTKVTSYQILKPYKILRKYVAQNTVNTATAVKCKKICDILDLSPSERTRESAKLINLCSLLKQTKAEDQAGLTEFDLKF